MPGKGVIRRVKDALWRTSDLFGIRPVRIRSGPARGSQICAPIRRWPSFRRALHEAPILAVIDRRVGEGQTVLDLGASYGYFTLAFAARVGSVGRVIAFEPESRAANALRRTLALNGLSQVRLIEAAVAETSRTHFLRVPENETMAYLTARPNGTAVDSVSLDDWLSRPPTEDAPQRVDWIKIDVEGAEAQVLSGAEETLTRYRPRILCEVHGSPAFPGGARETVERLRRAGYRLTPVPAAGRSLEERLHTVEAAPAGPRLHTFHLLAEAD
ncbi:MAG: FkbM family methyltransferase [Acidobacteriota bacterium]